MGTDTVTVADPDWVGSCTDFATMVSTPAPPGVNTPVALIAPTVVGPIDQLTAVIGLLVPITVAVQAVVCIVVIEAGKHETLTAVTVGGGGLTVTVTEALELPSDPETAT
jgi:hypothetical protein